MSSIYFKDNTCSNYKLQIRRFRDWFLANGWKETKKPEQADIIFIGTCAAFDILENESLQDIKEMNGLGKKVVVYGCLTTFNEKGIRNLHKGKMIPAWEDKSVENLIENPVVKLKDIPLDTVFRSREDYRVYDLSKRFVNICLGCPFNCSYCPHKLGIGPLKSRPFDEITTQVKLLLKERPKTIVLVGNEVGAYGIDIGHTYPELLKTVMGLSDTFKIHVSQMHPKWVVKYWDDLLELFGNERITDIQITIQTISRRLLKLMHRPTDTYKTLDFLKLVRKRNGKAVFRTDIMIGFPTETEEDLNLTLAAASEVFDEITLYGFEKKTGVPLDKMGFEFFSTDEIRKRLDYAVDFLSKKKCLVTRGGQVCIDEMKKADKRKHKLYIEKENV